MISFVQKAFFIPNPRGVANVHFVNRVMLGGVYLFCQKKRGLQKKSKQESQFSFATMEHAINLFRKNFK